MLLLERQMSAKVKHQAAAKVKHQARLKAKHQARLYGRLVLTNGSVPFSTQNIGAGAPDNFRAVEK